MTRYFKGSKKVYGSLTSQRTKTVLQWYSSDDHDAGRRRISNRFYAYERFSPIANEQMLDGWVRHGEVEDGLTARGQSLLLPS